VFLGAVGFLSLPVNLFPDIVIPSVRVVTEYPKAGTEEVEGDVTKVIEDKLSAVGGLKKIFSYSREEESEVVLNFDWGIDINEVMAEVREKLDQARLDLPVLALEPRIERFNPSDQPVLIVNFFSRSQADILPVINTVVKPFLERIKGVANIEIAGGREKQVLISVDEGRLTNYGISILELKLRLQQENVSADSGKITAGPGELVVRTEAAISSPEELRNVIIRKNIMLKDVASITEVYKKRENISRMNLNPAIEGSIYKESGANTVNIVSRLKRELKRILKPYPGIEFSFSFDQSSYINQSLQLLKGSATVGVFLAVIVLGVFLRKFKTALVIVLSIPVSIIASFWIFSIADVSLNLFSLAGLALAVGMVVDNSIVVLENIFRHMNEGRIVREAAVSGTMEIMNSVIASTLTTVAAFVPIIFMTGLVAQLFRDISVAIIVTLFFSLLVSFSLVPMLSSRLLAAEAGEEKRGFFDNIGKRVSGFYHNILQNLVEKGLWRFVFSALILILFFLTLKCLPQMAFLPKTQSRSLNIEARLPPGTNLEQTNEISKTAESYMAEIKGIKNITTRVIPHRFRMIFSVDRKEDVSAVIREIRARFNLMPDVRYKLKRISPLPDIGFGSAGESDIAVKVAGSSLSEIRKRTGFLKNKLAKLLFIRDIVTYPEGHVPVLEVRILKQRAARMGVTSVDIAEALRLKIKGEKVTDLKNERESDVFMVSGREEISPDRLGDISVLNKEGNPVLLKDVSVIEKTSAPTSIIREEKQRIYTLGIELKDGINLGSAVTEIEKRIKEISGGEESYYIGGTGESMKESFGKLLFALIIALVLVYMIMAAQFESLLHPFVIMFTVPASLLGAFWALIISGETINITSLLGIIMLSGIVVNNAIILISYTNILRQRGIDLSRALVMAGSARLRPILMTTLTTLLAMLPLALGIGSGAELYKPLAIVVVGGLSVSTLLTLLYVPAAYIIIESIRENISLARLKIKVTMSKGKIE